jgi:hypothetical protein
MAGLSIVALIATGWRKPARATANPARARRPLHARYGEPVEDTSLVLHRRTPWWKRVRAVGVSGAMAIAMGAVIATLVASGIAFLVIRLTDLLRQ